MLKFKMIGKHKWLMACAVLIIGFTAIHMVRAVEVKTPEPGTSADPLVSQSYVEQKFTEVKNYTETQNEELLKQISEKMAQLEDINKQLDETTKQFTELSEQVENLEQQLNEGMQQSVKFVVVENLKAGQKLIADESTEIILRAGKVTAIASEKGGLSDVTAAKDIKQSESVQPNHLIIVPRTDGRGVRSEADAVLLVKGTFRIEPMADAAE